MRYRQTRSKQRGATLVISLFILLVLTLLGVSAMQGTFLEEKMTGNMRDQQIALQAAEAAIYVAENYIESITTTGRFDGTNGFLGVGDPEPDFFDTSTWTDNTKSSLITYSDLLGSPIPGIDAANQPRVVIKHLGDVSGGAGDEGAKNIIGYGGGNTAGTTDGFRITARSSGASGTSQIIIQGHYGRKM